tara:strand:- start:636 stop:1541 length:906 start_codon:yes stop_codon:yes gene_type:complete
MACTQTPVYVLDSDTDSDCFVVSVTAGSNSRAKRLRKTRPAPAASGADSDCEAGEPPAKRFKPTNAQALADVGHDAAYRVAKAGTLEAKALSVVGSADFTALTTAQTLELARFIDATYFHGLVAASGYTLSTATNAGSAAGFCKVNRAKRTLVVKLNHACFCSIPVGEVRVSSGVRCASRLAALLNVLQHEMVHALIFVTMPKTDDAGKRITPHGPLFQTLARQLFGHTDFVHMLDCADASADFFTGVDRDRPALHTRYTVVRSDGRQFDGVVKARNPRRATMVTDAGKTWKVPYNLIKRA